MILDQLTHAARYANVLPRLDLAFKFLRQTIPETPTGRQDLDGDALYALVQRYTTRPI
ncbi:YhcH/YjgK/YiaL family protein, partial [bacterium]|nr:YhcH/YjgK/YiaL family protein [bacterium]